jgi:hypothetical protein
VAPRRREVAADSIALWTRLGALPPDLDPGVRAKELCAAAYRDGELIGVSTMVLDILPQLKARFGFFRTTLLGWSYYSERSLEYLFGVRIIKSFRIAWCIAVSARRSSSPSSGCWPTRSTR